MKYMGSKNRIAKEILPIILKDYKEGMIFIDACCGGCNLLDKVPNNVIKYGNDINYYLIEMWKAVSNGWLPPKEFTEEEYKNIRNKKDDYPPELVGYVGFALSYGGKWFGGWCRDSENKRDYVLEAYNNAIKQFPKLKGVKFSNKSIYEIDPKIKAIIYCDIPYKNSTKYKDDFNYEEFYNWCRIMTSKGNIIFVSEYSMPKDFECIWQKEIVSSLTANTGDKKGIEKLFIHKGD